MTATTATATTDDLTVEVTPARTVLLVLALDTGAEGVGGPVEFSVELSAETACAFGDVLTQAGKAAAGQVGVAATQPGAVQRRAEG